MSDVFTVLSQVSGIPRTEMQQIWEQVKANSRTLDACAGPHDFQSQDRTRPLAKYTCTKCGGEVDGTDKLWYERGLAHGRR